MSEQRTFVTFKTDGFNTTESRPEFINPENYGDDLGRWLAGELRRLGVDVQDEVGQEDFGWYLTYSAGGTEYTFQLGWREDGTDSAWIGWVERSAGFIASILGGRRKGIERDGLVAIHSALSGSDRVREVVWYTDKDFKSGRESAGSSTP